MKALRCLGLTLLPSFAYVYPVFCKSLISMIISHNSGCFLAAQSPSQSRSVKVSRTWRLNPPSAVKLWPKLRTSLISNGIKPCKGKSSLENENFGMDDVASDEKVQRLKPPGNPAKGPKTPLGVLLLGLTTLYCGFLLYILGILMFFMSPECI